jgi:G-protein alpha subunit
MSSLDRLFDPGYLPTEEDIFRTETPTAGVTELIFQINDHGGIYDVMVINVNEYHGLRKWIDQFQDVASIFFVVNLSSYDQFLPDDRGIVRLFLT